MDQLLEDLILLYQLGAGDGRQHALHPDGRAQVRALQLLHAAHPAPRQAEVGRDRRGQRVRPEAARRLPYAERHPHRRPAQHRVRGRPRRARLRRHDHQLSRRHGRLRPRRTAPDEGNRGASPSSRRSSRGSAASDFIHASCAVADFGIEFGGGGIPRWSATLRNTGYSFQRARDLGTPIVPPAVDTYHYIHPAAVSAKYNDGSLVDLASLARLISGRCGISQDIEVVGLPGDPFRRPGDRRSGAYARRIRRGKRTATPTIKAYMDETLGSGWTR
jgi:hypothetical protein